MIIKINDEVWIPYYKWVYMGPYSCGFYILSGWRKAERYDEK